MSKLFLYDVWSGNYVLYIFTFQNILNWLRINPVLYWYWSVRWLVHAILIFSWISLRLVNSELMLLMIWDLKVNLHLVCVIISEPNYSKDSYWSKFPLEIRFFFCWNRSNVSLEFAKIASDTMGYLERSQYFLCSFILSCKKL